MFALSLLVTSTFAFLITCLAIPPFVTGANNMNDGIYEISNSDKYSAEFFGEYFDVYTPLIRTRYSEVYWAPVVPVPLPPEIVERFLNKTMAITGYETDQVRVDDEGNEIPVPITHAYNHHYSASIIDSRVGRWEKKMYSKEELANSPQLLGMTHGTGHYYDFVYYDDKKDFPLHDDDENPDPNNGAAYSSGTVFSEANGGEYRRTYHGYPKGYAQLVRSPDQFNIYVMQIDTKNRDYGNSPKFYPGPLPRISPIYGDDSATYSGLVECPCSTRRKRSWTRNYKMEDAVCDECPNGGVQNETECWDGFRHIVPFAPRLEKYTYSGNTSVVSGCSLLQREDGVLQLTWNEPVATRRPEVALEENDSIIAVGTSSINATVILNEEQAVLTLVGPADKWFGIGFGTSTMCRKMEADECLMGGPYAIIVYNDTDVEERVLDFHGRGKQLPSTIKIVSNTVQEGNRTVVLTRPLIGADDRYYSFDTSVVTLNVIMARGCNTTFAQHCGHGSTTMQFLPLGKTMRVCRDGISGGIDGQAFAENRCGKFPISTLLESHNPTCSIETYQGGLSCCRHGQSLLDEDQEIPWPDQFLEYRLKFRFYFEEHVPANENHGKPSHKQVTRLYWQTESFAGEYDVTPCSVKTPRSQCIHVITARWKVRNMLIDGHWEGWSTGPDSSQADGIELISAMPHCHAPSCLSMELYNADTGELLCHAEPIVGKSIDKVYDELGFLTIPPCLWSDNVDDGLMAPIFLSADTTLLAIKRNNNTVGHFGEMASWQMRGVIIMNGTKKGEHVVLEVEKSVPDFEKEKNLR